MKMSTWILATVATVWIVAEVTSSPAVPPTAAETEAAKKKADRAAQVQELMDKGIGTGVQVAKDLKARARNPDSFVVERVGMNATGDTVCLNYRAQNGFGGMNREGVAIHKRTAYQDDSAAWKKYCKQELMDITSMVHNRI